MRLWRTVRSKKNHLKEKLVQFPASSSPSHRWGDFGLNKLTFASDSKKPQQPCFSESLAQQLPFPGDHWGDQCKNHFPRGLDGLVVK